ncbi:MAG: DoxX family protein [Chitinophagaceae bacterium]|nr:DoxX family protein [Chitinophagaceae bacterium]
MKPLNINLGLLLLRITTGGLLLFHGVSKLMYGFDFIKGMLAEKGFPQFLWLGVPITEVIAPVLLISGVFTRISGLGISLLMLFTIILVHAAEAFTISQSGGLSIELNLLYLSGGLTLFFTGGGKYALYKPANEWLR